MAPPSSAARPGVALALITDAAIVAYGLWTVVSNLTVVLGGSAQTGLNLGAALCVAAAAALLIGALGRPRWIESYRRWAASAVALDAPLVMSRKARAALFVAVPAAMLVWLATRSFVSVWLVALVAYGAAAAIGLRQAASSEPPACDPADELRRMRVTHGLAALCALFTLSSIRPRDDDPFYLSMSVSVVDYPTAPLLAARTLHGPPSDTLAFQPMFVPYKVHSFETLGGYISYLTGLDVTAVVHFGLATLFGWLATLACARFLRSVMPHGWLLALFGTISYLMIDGSAGRGFANQAFVRMFNGKGAMLTFALPMILYYGMRLGRQPDKLAFGLLAMAQISAMGMSSTAIWLSPMLAVLAVAAGTPRARALPRTVSLAVLSSFYVLAMGVWIFTELPPDQGVMSTGAAVQASSPTVAGAERLAIVIPDVLGGERAAIGLLAVFALASFLARNAGAFRLLAYIGLTLIALLANPWLTGFVGRYITGSGTYERAFWILPVPLAVGMCFAFSKQWLSARLTARESTLLAVALLIAFYAATVERLVIGEANRAWLQLPPALKVGPIARSVAESLCELAPRGAIVLAPESISQQLVTIPGCGAPVIAGYRWMVAPRAEKERRLQLQRYVSVVGDVAPDAVPMFRDDLGRYRIVAVAMTPQALKNRAVKEILRSTGFKKIRVVGKHHIWHRKLGR